MMCEKFKVSRSGFYAWLKRPAALRVQANAELMVHIRSLHQQNHEAYGSPRPYAALKAQSIMCGRHRIAR